MAVLRQQDGDSKNLQDILSVNSLGCLLLSGSTRRLTIPIVSSILEIEKESLPVRRLAQFTIYFLEKVVRILGRGRLLFRVSEEFHH